MAPRSGFVPKCAKRARLLALALFPYSACLNPMPEEFPSNDGEVTIMGTPGSGSVNDESGRPAAPETNSGGDLLGDDVGSAGSGGNASPPATQPPLTSGEGETEAPDAGADAGASSPEATGTEAAGPDGETSP